MKKAPHRSILFAVVLASGIGRLNAAETSIPPSPADAPLDNGDSAYPSESDKKRLEELQDLIKRMQENAKKQNEISQQEIADAQRLQKKWMDQAYDHTSLDGKILHVRIQDSKSNSVMELSGSIRKTSDAINTVEICEDMSCWDVKVRDIQYQAILKPDSHQSPSRVFEMTWRDGVVVDMVITLEKPQQSQPFEYRLANIWDPEKRLLLSRLEKMLAGAFLIEHFEKKDESLPPYHQIVTHDDLISFKIISGRN